MKKNNYLFLFISLCTAVLLEGCQGVVIEGKLVDALSNKPLARTSVYIDGSKTIKTDENGMFKIKRLPPMDEYNFTLQPEGYTSVSLHFVNQKNKKLINAGQSLVITQPPFPGVYVYDQGRYSQLSECQAYRFYLYYRISGKDLNYIPSSGDDRLAAWSLKDESISSIPLIKQGVTIVIWQSSIYNEIAPLYQYNSRSITCSSIWDIGTATFPGGWYIGLNNLVINENSNTWYAKLSYSINKWSFKELKSVNGQSFSIILTNFEPGKYAIINSEMDWNPNSSYAVVNGVDPIVASSVYAFEVIKN